MVKFEALEGLSSTPAHLHKASLSAGNQQPAIAAEGARVGLVLEAGQRGERAACVGIKDDHPSGAGHCIIVGVQRAEVYTGHSPNLHREGISL